MTAREFMSECNLFVEFGKIKDINFDFNLYYENIDDRVKVMDIDFKDNMVTLGTLVPFGCGEDCCGSYYENETYDLNLQNETIQNPHNWKTSNKVIIQEDTDEKQKNREKAKKSIDKKKAEMGIEAFNKLKAKQAKERRAKNKQEIIV